MLPLPCRQESSQCDVALLGFAGCTSLCTGCLISVCVKNLLHQSCAGPSTLGGLRLCSERQLLQEQHLGMEQLWALLKHCQQSPSGVCPAGEAGSRPVPPSHQLHPLVSGELSHTPQSQSQVTHLLSSYSTHVHTGKTVQNWMWLHFHCQFQPNSWKRKGNCALKPFLCPQSPLSG